VWFKNVTLFFFLFFFFSNQALSIYYFFNYLVFLCFPTDYTKPYLEAFPNNAKFFEEGTKWYKRGKGKRAGAEKHNAIYEQGAKISDLMEDAKEMILNSYINTESVQSTLQSVPKGKDEIKKKKQTESDVKRAQGDIESYSRNRWGMNFAVTLQDENGTDVLCPTVFWKWHAGFEEKSGESKTSKTDA